MALTRRAAVRTGAAALAGLAAGGCGSAGAAAEELTRIRVPTSAGTFDAVAAGPPEGRQVLLLHGFPELGVAWSAQLHALAAAGYRAVAPDQRGYSPGVRPSGVDAYQLEHPVADVLAMADSLGWKRFDLIGHDWGAVVSWIVAARQRDRVRTLTAVSVPHPAAFAEALRTDPLQRKASGYMRLFRQPAPGPERKILAGGPPKLAGVSSARSAEYFRRLSQPGALTAALNWYRANDFTGFAQPVRVPTLFLASDRDPMVARSGIVATRRWVHSDYRLVTLPGIGHNIPEQAAADTSRLLLRHLQATRE